MSKIWFMEVKSLMFNHKKIISVLKPKMYVHWSNVFVFQRSFLELQISHP
jgi:hypothetical protein